MAVHSSYTQVQAAMLPFQNGSCVHSLRLSVSVSAALGLHPSALNTLLPRLCLLTKRAQRSILTYSKSIHCSITLGHSQKLHLVKRHKRGGVASRLKDEKTERGGNVQ